MQCVMRQCSFHFPVYNIFPQLQCCIFSQYVWDEYAEHSQVLFLFHGMSYVTLVLAKVHDTLFFSVYRF